jgi:uncharacterized membrane protein YGL010W
MQTVAAVVYMTLWKMQKHYYLSDPNMHFKASLGMFIATWILQSIGHRVL